jgi:hypothetical protein
MSELIERRVCSAAIAAELVIILVMEVSLLTEKLWDIPDSITGNGGKASCPSLPFLPDSDPPFLD